MATQKNPKKKKRGGIFRLTIGAKLVSLIAFVLVAAVVSVVWVSTRMFIEDNTALIQQLTSDTSSHLSSRVRESVAELTQKIRVLGSVHLPGAGDKASITQEMFAGDEDWLALYVHAFENGNPVAKGRAISQRLGKIGDTQGDITWATLSAEKRFLLSQVEKGEPQVIALKLSDGTGAIVLSIPFVSNPQLPDRFSFALTAIVKQARFLKIFGTSDVVTSFLVDRKGNLLAHPDPSLVAASESVAHLEVVKQMLVGKINNGQTRYIDPQTSEARLGAFHLVGFAGLGVVAEVPEAKAFEAAKKVEHRAMLVAAIVLCLAFLAGYLYSDTITWPIKQLVVAADRISNGDFKIALKPKTRDEVADLSIAFNEMAKGLEERDRVKTTFAKFHNKEIAEKLLSGEVKLGGERLNSTIFFSDIRGFTRMSETLQPEEVVEMLNEYMTVMVSIIRKYGGVVDKYVGDSIMALWGVPVAGPKDSANAVNACLAMRVELAQLNELRKSRGQAPLKVGMGLNQGLVIAGNIGSDEKMEYTVIGDSVNTASRIESMTKELGTDLLVAGNIQGILKDQFIFEPCQEVQVKGKSEALKLFKVVGYVNERGEKISVQTSYSSYEKSQSDKSVPKKAA